MPTIAERNNGFVSHGWVTHPVEDCKNCEDCIKTKEAFELAQQDGTLDKLLGNELKI